MAERKGSEEIQEEFITEQTLADVAKGALR